MMKSSFPRRTLVPLLALIAVGTLHACSDSTAPSGPAAVQAVAAGELVVDAGATESVAVFVTDASGRAMSGIAVDWSTASPGGSVSPQQSRTDASGEARASWTVGTTAGSYELTARVTGLPPLTLTAIVRAGAPTSITEHGDPPTTGVVATAVEPAPSVIVRDAQGTPVPDVPVRFAIGSGFGSVSGAEQTTNADGVATVGGWKLGIVTVPNTLTVTAGTLGPVTFRVLATPGAPAILRVRSGTDQSAPASVFTPVPPSVWVQDEHRNAVQGVVVDFVVTAGGGSLTGAQPVSDASGIATVEAWRLGPAAGSNSVTASFPGAEPVVFAAVAGPPAAAMVISEGDGQTAAAGTAVPVAPAVLVLDEVGAPVTGALVEFAVTAGGGTVTEAQATSGADGVAQAGHWILGDVGENALAATVSLLPPLSFNAQAVDPAQLFELVVEAVHLNQGSQTMYGTVGGIAGRPGMLRVVARANATNLHSPPVRVRLYQGTTLIREELLPAPAVGVPTHPDLEVTTHTYDLLLSAADVVPGLTVEVELDPDDVLRVRTPEDKRFPRGGGAASLDVDVLHPLRVVFIPIHASAHQLTGMVDTSNMELFLTETRRWLPVEQIVPSVLEPFSTGLDLRDGSNWPRLLSELQAKRTAEGARDEYYHGIVPDFPGTPWTGYAYIPNRSSSPSRTAVTYDRLPWASATVAHELGHNMGRRHAPCGNVLGADGRFPHPSATLGSPGFDIATGELVFGENHRDFMSYCSPKWTSDYTFDAIVNWRRADPLAIPASDGWAAPATTAVPGVLVWGRIHSGGVELNPAFALSAPPSLPDAPGRDLLRGTDAAGRELFRLSFDGERVDHSTDPSERHFAFFVPMRDGDIADLTMLEVIVASGDRASALASPETAAADLQDPAAGEQGEVRINRAPGGQLRLNWDAAHHPMALVRDPLTGEVLAFARAGEALVHVGDRGMEGVEVLLSDGVRSRRATRRAR